MGGRSTKMWQPPRTDEEERRAKQNQAKCWMIQQLATDCDAQYLCYQPFLQLSDIIHLSRTCHIWCHWIRSPTSVLHLSIISTAHHKNRIAIPTIRHVDELNRLINCKWIQPYLRGCRIMPVHASKEWGEMMKCNFSKFLRSDSPPRPLLTQLLSFSFIQHLSLGHLHPHDMKRERISQYFKAVSPTLRSLELHPNPSNFLIPNPYETVAYLNRFLVEIRHLGKLQELRISLNGAHHLFEQLHLNHLPSLPHFRTFLCQNTHQSYEDYWHRAGGATLDLSQCRRLRCVSLGQFPTESYLTSDKDQATGSLKMAEFILHRHMAQQLVEIDGIKIKHDPLEYIELNTTWMVSSTWVSLAQHLPRLKTINPYCWHIQPREWSLLTNFAQLTYIHIQPAKGSILIVDFFLDHLIGCTTLESLTLRRLQLTETQLETIVRRLIHLRSLILSHVTLGYHDPSTPSSRLHTLTFCVCLNNLLIQVRECDRTHTIISWKQQRTDKIVQKK